MVGTACKKCHVFCEIFQPLHLHLHLGHLQQTLLSNATYISAFVLQWLFNLAPPSGQYEGSQYCKTFNILISFSCTLCLLFVFLCYDGEHGISIIYIPAELNNASMLKLAFSSKHRLILLLACLQILSLVTVINTQLK